MTTTFEPGKRLLNQLNKLQQVASGLLALLEDHPELKASKPARELKKPLGSPTLQKAKKPRKEYTRQHVETFQPGISHPLKPAVTTTGVSWFHSRNKSAVSCKKSKMTSNECAALRRRTWN